MSKSESKSIDRPNRGRRSFIWKAGAALSAVLATAIPAVSMTGPSGGKDPKKEADRLACKLADLEDEKKIRLLHQDFETLLDSLEYENLVKLFSHDGEVKFNGGVFKGKEKGVRRFFCEYFRSGQAGKKMIPAPGFELNNDSKIEVSSNHLKAKAQYPFSIQVGSPMISDSVLIKMARLQGGGILRWWEGGLYQVSYAKDAGDGNWKIKTLEYHTLARADYRPGRSCSKPIEVPLFSKVYPDDPVGPDMILSKLKGTQKV